MESEKRPFSISSNRERQIMDGSKSHVPSFNLAVDLCTISDVLWSVIHRQKDDNPSLYKDLEANGLLGLASRLTNRSYQFYQSELDKASASFQDVTLVEINHVLKSCFKTLSDKGFA